MKKFVVVLFNEEFGNTRFECDTIIEASNIRKSFEGNAVAVVFRNY